MTASFLAVSNTEALDVWFALSVLENLVFLRPRLAECDSSSVRNTGDVSTGLIFTDLANRCLSSFRSFNVCLIASSIRLIGLEHENICNISSKTSFQHGAVGRNYFVEHT